MNVSEITQEQLKTELSFDPDTGIFRRLRATNAEPIGQIAGNVAPNGRRSISVCGVRFLASHLAVLYMTGALPKGYVKQRDGNYDNLIWTNLFEESPSESVLRGRVRGKSGIRGVSWEQKRGQWQATIAVFGKVVHLGRYDTIEDATKARRSAEAELSKTGAVQGVKGDRAASVMENRLRRLWAKITLFYDDTGWSSFAEFAKEVGSLPEGWLGIERVNSAEKIGPKNWRFVRRFDRRTPEGRAGYQRQRRAENPELFQAQELKKWFGLTLDDYKAMLVDQKGVCAICGQPETAELNGKLKALGVDHNHDTGQIRDLLCYSCNLMIGHARENLEILFQAMSYLKRHLTLAQIARYVPKKKRERADNVIPLRKESA
jgi:Recombination endonuclease VII/AP2 domain